MKREAGILISLSVALILAGGPAKAQYTTIDPFGSTDVNLTAVSGENVIGSYYTPSVGWSHFPFLYNVATGSLTTLDPPGSGFSIVAGIDGTNIVGYYSTGPPIGPSPGDYLYGFLYNGSTYTTISPPGAVPGGGGTFLSGVSGSNVVGYYGNSDMSETGFLYNAATNTYTSLTPPGALTTYTSGVSGNSVVGYYANGVDTTAAFLYNAETNTYTSLTPPGAYSSSAFGVSGGVVFGEYTTSFGGTSFGFLYNLSTDTYTTLAPPGAGLVVGIVGVSGGEVYGSYPINETQYGFQYNLSTDTYTTLVPPGATTAAVTGVSGDIVVGSYETSPGIWFGFMYVVPEPSGLVLLSIGLATSAVLLVRRTGRHAATSTGPERRNSAAGQGLPALRTN